MAEFGNEWKDLKGSIDVLYKLVKDIEKRCNGKNDEKTDKKSVEYDNIVNFENYKSRSNAEKIKASFSENYKINGYKEEKHEHKEEKKYEQENYNADELLKILDEKLNDEKMKSEKTSENLEDIMSHIKMSNDELEQIDYLIERINHYPKQISEILYKDYIQIISKLPRSEKNDYIVYKTLGTLSDFNQHIILEDKDGLLIKMDENRWNIADLDGGKKEDRQKASKRKFFGFMF